MLNKLYQLVLFFMIIGFSPVQISPPLFAEKPISHPPTLRCPVPLEHQAQETFCGAAAVTSLFLYFGANPNYGDKRAFQIEVANTLATNAGAKGTCHEDMIRLLEANADNLGYQVTTQEQMTLADLEKALDEGAPVLLFLQAWDEFSSNESDYEGYYGLGHAVVAVDYDDNHIFFMDPWISGQYAHLSKEQLLKRWHYPHLHDNNQRYEHLGVILTPVKEQSPHPQGTTTRLMG